MHPLLLLLLLAVGAVAFIFGMTMFGVYILQKSMERQEKNKR